MAPCLSACAFAFFLFFWVFLHHYTVRSLCGGVCCRVGSFTVWVMHLCSGTDSFHPLHPSSDYCVLQQFVHHVRPRVIIYTSYWCDWPVRRVRSVPGVFESPSLDFQTFHLLANDAFWWNLTHPHGEACKRAAERLPKEGSVVESLRTATGFDSR